MALSTSSKLFFVAPLTTIDAVREDSLSWRKMVTLSPPISLVSTTSTVPISSGIGAPSLAKGVPPQTLAILLRSNLDGTLKLFREAPMILTTRIESTLKSFGLFFGITLIIASATRSLIFFSLPYCFDAITGWMIFSNSSFEFKSEIWSITKFSSSFKANLLARLYP
ncbi:hypothetical protein OGATHE_006681 [Ogataea polymorpha]|uniref:Uncharacterized protein n=1 Tax=Ogataea polymorpha TaxID=460523 RepID=A0A9P8SYL8_9ASCO|nr:hypothetical protein OGATHE_006681 [Ogataea polymorpha]